METITKEERAQRIIRTLRPSDPGSWETNQLYIIAELDALIQSAVEEEREACAKIVEGHSNPYNEHDCYEQDCRPWIAMAIRQRRQPPTVD